MLDITKGDLCFLKMLALLDYLMDIFCLNPTIHVYKNTTLTHKKHYKNYTPNHVEHQVVVVAVVVFLTANRLVASEP